MLRARRLLSRAATADVKASAALYQSRRTMAGPRPCTCGTSKHPQKLCDGSHHEYLQKKREEASKAAAAAMKAAEAANKAKGQQQ